MKRKILIVDDEELGRRRIRAFFQKRAEAYEVREASDGFAALEAAGEFDPDLIFLDVQMPEMTGFDVIRHLGASRAKIVFQTAFDEFALRAFEVNACDYLLKPFTDERLTGALERAFSGGPPAEKISQSIDTHMAKEKAYLDRLVIKVGNKRKVVGASEVKYFLSEEHVTRVFLDGADYAYDLSLTQLQERLDPERYARIHRNCLVKMEEIASYGQGPHPEVVLKDGTRLKASREGARALKRNLT